MTAPLPDAAPVPPQGSSEPVLIAHAVTVALAALAGWGWVAIPDQTIDLIGTAVVLVVSTVAAVAARAKVRPTTSASTADTQLWMLGVVRQELAALQAFQAVQAAAQPPQPVPLAQPLPPWPGNRSAPRHGG